MPLVKISPKVIVRTAGLLKVKGGNHRASHLGWRRSANPDITVFHYPIRSYDQFKRNVVNRVGLLDRPGVRMGPHYRRWVRLYNEGRLEEEFERMVLSPVQLELLEAISVVRRNEHMTGLLAACMPK